MVKSDRNKDARCKTQDARAEKPKGEEKCKVYRSNRSAGYSSLGPKYGSPEIRTIRPAAKEDSHHSSVLLKSSPLVGNNRYHTEHDDDGNASHGTKQSVSQCPVSMYSTSA